MLTPPNSKRTWLFCLCSGVTLFVSGGLMTVFPCGTASGEETTALLAELSRPISDAEDLAPLIAQAKDKPFVLLGEASHGTSEFYSWRADISRILVKEHGFNYIAVEGDWDACYELNRYVKDMPGAADNAEDALRAFDRWPPWMWANRDVETLVEWLRGYNKDREAKDKVGFYGIDVYGFEGSLRGAVEYLESLGDEDAAEAARAVHECLDPYMSHSHAYSRAVHAGIANCALPAEAVVTLLREQEETLRAKDEVAWFNAKQHALVVKNAERHYRVMALRSGNSWNKRVAHFQRTVERLADFYGPDAKGIVWAHNTHIGDARATPMADGGQHNIGQLLRVKHGDNNVYAVGFGTHRGAVLAGRSWGGAMERMPTPLAMPGSLEDMLYQTGHDAQLLLLDRSLMDGVLGAPLPHRAIGVTYDPAAEHRNYVPTVLPQRYDAFIFIAETTPLDPIHE